MDKAELTFDDGALEAVAERAMERKIGARGLRAVLESVMQKIMYDVPSDESIVSVRITEDAVRKGADPIVVRKAQ